MVISGGGTGIPVYRQLQKDDTPFCAGILYTGDIDYAVARHLAARIITERPYRSISPESMAQAEREIDRCRLVIDAGVEIGEINAGLRDLLKLAEEKGKLCSREAFLQQGEKL